MIDVILKRFEDPDEVRRFELGRFELVRVGGVMYVSPHFLGAQDDARHA